MLIVKLVVVGGATEGDEFQPSLPSVLGRSRDAGIPLPHPLVSRQHCELFERDNRLFVRDLESTNGTFVGSERVNEEMLIDHGSLLTIGTVTFRAYYDGLPRPAFSPSTPTNADSGTFEQADSEIETSRMTRVDTGDVGLKRSGKPGGVKESSRMGERAK